MKPGERHSLISRLFLDALDQQPEHRRAWLHSATDNHEIRFTVEEMLRAHDIDDGLLDRPLLIRSEVNNVGVVDDVKGKRVGPWEIQDKLGEGGMGVVYRARRADGLYQRTVALKILAPGSTLSTGDRFARRLVAERRILARLDHEGIARMYDGGISSDGVPYLALELVDGEPITVYAKRKGLNINERIALFIRACDAVAYAHRNLVVHRDLKPAHVLIADDEGGGLPGVKLLDFGISALLEATDDDGQTLLTVPRALTPTYAAPEQLTGENISTASDIYSLGIILYELLSGVRPYELTGKTAAEVERLVVNADPLFPSSVTAPDIRRSLQGDLDTIVMKSLAKEPSRRYNSADAFADDLRRYLARTPILARPSTLGYRAGKYIKRHSVGVGVTGATFLLIVLMTAVYTIRLAAERDLTAAALDRSERTLQFLRTVIAAGGVEEGDPNTPIGVVLDSAAVQALNLDDEPTIARSIHLTLGGVFRDLGKMDAAETEANRTIALFSESERDSDYGRAWHLLGMARMGQDDFDGALAAVEIALAYLPVAEQISSVELVRSRASALNTYGDVLSELEGRMEDAEAAYEESIHLYRRINDSAVTNPLAGLGIVYNIGGRQEEAIPLFEAIVESLRVEFDRPHYRLGIALSNLGATLNDLERYDEARPYLRESVDVFDATVGRSHPNAMIAHVTYGLHLNRAGRFEEAIEEGKKFVATAIESFGPDHSLTAFAQNVAGQSYCDGGRAAEGAELLRLSTETRRSVLPPGNWLVANGESLLGACYSKVGRMEDAEQLLSSSHKALLEILGPEHIKTIEAGQRLRAFYTSAGLTDKAEVLPDS